MRKWIQGIRMLGEAGVSLLQVMVFAGLAGGLALYFASRSLIYKENMMKMSAKSEVTTDRKLILFELTTRPMPSPTY